MTENLSLEMRRHIELTRAQASHNYVPQTFPDEEAFDKEENVKGFPDEEAMPELAPEPMPIEEPTSEPEMAEPKTAKAEEVVEFLKAKFAPPPKKVGRPRKVPE